MLLIIATLSLHFDRGSSVTCRDNDCTSLHVLKHCSLLFFFYDLIRIVPTSLFCSASSLSSVNRNPAVMKQLVSILTGHHLDIRGIKTFRNGISANDFIR